MAGDLESAREAYLEVLAMQPEHADTLHLLGVLHNQQGKHVAGLVLLQRALSLAPDNPALMSNIALAFKELGCLQDAADWYRKALELDPAFHPARKGFGRVCAILADTAHDQDKREDALRWYETCLSVEPKNVQILNNIAIIYQQMGRIEPALAVYRTALSVPNPPAYVYSNYLLALNLSMTTSQREYFAAAKSFSDQGATPPPSRRCSQRKDRPLRVGYISADFSGHAVSTFILPLLAKHDPKKIEPNIFSNAALSPGDEAWLKNISREVYEIHELSDDEALTLIRNMGLDILVDLSGHTAGNRLPLLSRRAAPVQTTWLGYFNTTGVPGIDNFLADERCCPQRMDTLFTERVVRLPNSFFCYTPIDIDISVSETPSRSGAPFTFGCLNETAKLNKEVIQTWAVILRRIPGSRLLLRAKGFADLSIIRRFQTLFSSHDIAPDRLILLGPVSHTEYLETYRKIDLCLDPFPYNGGTVTCDALWMGVPVITWAGEMMASRMGYSILHAARLEHLVAHSRHDYIAKAVELACHPEKLHHVRSGLRETMLSSELCDKGKFMMALGEAYHSMAHDFPAS